MSGPGRVRFAGDPLALARAARDTPGAKTKILGAVARIAAVSAVLWSGACQLEDGHPPVARASADPDTIPEHDEFQTPVGLDGSESADPIDDPDASQPLDYRWRIEGDEYRFESGSDTSMSPVVSFRGARPATVELTVTDQDGMSHTTSFEMRLTVSP